MRFVKTLIVGITLAAAVSGLHAQTNPASSAGATPAKRAAGTSAQQSAKPAGKSAAQTPAKPAAASASAAQNKTAAAPAAQNKPAAAAANKPATAGTKPGSATTNAKAAGQTGKTSTQAAKPKQASKPARKAAPRKPVTSAANTAADKEPKVAKRDPFESLLGREQGGPKGPLPPGKAGLQVGTLRLDGIVRAPNGMIAVVSNPQSRTYFLREGDQLYDGRVEKIAMDGVSFHEIGKDAFGKPVERQVNKRIYASAGEQQ
jgi:hypothetical protein